MKKLSKKKLGLHQEAIRVLQDAMLENTRGGLPGETFSCGCPTPTLCIRSTQC